MRCGGTFFPRLFPAFFVLACLCCSASYTASAQVLIDTTSTSVQADTARADSVVADSLRTDSLQQGKNGLEYPVHYQAQDSIRFDLRRQKIYLFNKAAVEYENMKLDAARITIDADSNLVFAEAIRDSNGQWKQQPVFKEKSDEYRARRMVYNFKSEKGKIYEIATTEGEGLVYGDEVKKDEEGVMYIQDARYTTCTKPHPHFFIKASRIKVIPKEKIISGPAQLVVGDVPLPLVAPFGFFPNSSKGASGVLVPKYGESNNQGFFLRDGGYFLRINDYLNAKIQGDIYSRGSWRLNGVMRYKKRYGYNGNLDVNVARQTFGDEESPDFTDERTFFVTWRHQQSGKARPGTNFSADVRAGSSSFLRNNSYNTNDLVTNQLRSSVNYNKNWLGTPFNLSASLSHDQNTQTEQVNLELPTINFGVTRINPFEREVKVGDRRWYEDIGLNYNLGFKNRVSGPEDRIFDQDTARFLWSNGFRQSSSLSTNFKVLKYFTLSPSLNYTGFLYTKRRNRVYDLERDTLIETVSNEVNYGHQYNVSSSLNTRVYGMFNINRLGIKAIRHVVTPRISASYSPDFSRQRLGGFESVVNADRLEEPDSVEADVRPYSIFYKPVYGTPGRGESGRMSFSLNNNFEMKVNQKTDTGMAVKKVKLVDALNFSGSYNFLADSQKLSNINANFRTRILDKYDIQVNATVDPYALAPNGRRIDQFLWDDKRRLGRLTSMQVAFQTDFRSMKGEKQEGTSFYDPYYTSFEAPWNFGLRYNLNYTKPRFTAETRQQVNFNASLNLTDNWRLQGNSGYDLTNQKFSTTSINIGRDLHCWQFDVRWIPFGSRRSYYFSLNVKASVLQDLKIDKRQDFFDFTER